MSHLGLLGSLYTCPEMGVASYLVEVDVDIVEVDVVDVEIPRGSTRRDRCRRDRDAKSSTL
jgi:hypothetical protein